MEPILCTELLDLVHIDYVSMEVLVGVTEKPVVKNVLVVKDHFTRFTQAYVTNNHTARTTACILYNEFFSVFGFPRRLMSDQASEFTGQVILELCDLLGITKIRDVAISSADQWHRRTSTSDAQEDDSQDGPLKKEPSGPRI